MMPQNTLPYLIPFKDTINTIHLTESDIQSLGIPVVTTNLNFVPTIQQTIEASNFEAINNIDMADTNVKIEGENETLVFQVVYPEELDLKPSTVKRGRPKRKKVQEEQPIVPAVKQSPPKSARTRCGRLVKLPKHIEKNFKKIEITDEPELKTTEFVRFEEKENANQPEIKGLETHQKKRIISSQFRCPKCQKAYLGKSKMIQHLLKNPDHGPLPDKLNELNFDVWNYLVDVTQKSPPGQRGNKFCEELTNLLHNLQLLTTALFKKEESENNVNVDKVLGNAIGLNPGMYRFDENELYKDVTVLKLIENSDFFNPTNCSKVFNSEEKLSETETKNPEKLFTKEPENFSNSVKESQNIDFQPETLLNDFSYSDKTFSTNIADESAHMNMVSYSKNSEKDLDDRISSLHSDLLSENSLLNSLPHSSVDELLSGVEVASNLLDNSDEVMNVDQFVNERFKKITEPDIELSNSSLNLDLPSLDLFQFHTN